MSHVTQPGSELTSTEINMVAGLNLLVPSTSPIAKTGTTTFADTTGGGTSAIEIPSGTVNGVNKIFTVQNVPVWIEVSGQTMVSQATDSTNYGYTLTGSSAPYTVTFLTAPASTQTPHSCHN